MTAKNSTQDKVKKVNAELKKGEPGNISLDSYSGYAGYKPQYIIDTMNKVFGIGKWGFNELESKYRNKGDDGKPQLAISQVEVWLDGVEFKPTAYGQSRITRDDYGDAKKGAQTDAIKKALSYFSIGNRAFYGLLNNKGKKS